MFLQALLKYHMTAFLLFCLTFCFGETNTNSICLYSKKYTLYLMAYFITNSTVYIMLWHVFQKHVFLNSFTISGAGKQCFRINPYTFICTSYKNIYAAPIVIPWFKSLANTKFIGVVLMFLENKLNYEFGYSCILFLIYLVNILLSVGEGTKLVIWRPLWVHKNYIVT